MNKYIRFFLIIFYFFLFNLFKTAPVFLNRYLLPEPNYEILTNRDFIESTRISFFNLLSNDANISSYFDKNLNQYSNKKNLFEYFGPLNFYSLDESLKKINKNYLETGFPSEWKAEGIPIFMSLPGKINCNGIFWDITKNIFEKLIIGWNSGFAFEQSCIALKMEILNEKIPLYEGILSETFRIYRSMTEKLSMKNVYEKRASILDQNFYLKYKFFFDFIAECRRISCELKTGVIIATAEEKDIYNPASIPLGTNGHNGIYGNFSIDILLKEDLSIGFVGQIFNLFSKEKKERFAYELENPLYGVLVKNAKINPGLTSSFSTYLILEGIRNGLGAKILYSTFNHFKDKIDLNCENISFNKEFNERFTDWAQESIGITIFYDFIRNENSSLSEPILAFNANIPVNFFFSHDSSRCYSMSLIFEIYY